MRHSIKVGFSFGFTSGILTTLGLMVGLHSGTHSRLAILSGILTIAIADAFSDAMGIHVSEESENKHSATEIWESTIATFLSKFILALTFTIPLFLFDLSTAIIAAAAWGILLLTIFNFLMAKAQNEKPWKVAGEHLLITALVILVTHYIGHFCESLAG
jgi:VIT1/CCC1 family predicted Fe2+/Mn2+ transporter